MGASANDFSEAGYRTCWIAQRVRWKVSIPVVHPLASFKTSALRCLKRTNPFRFSGKAIRASVAPREPRAESGSVIPAHVIGRAGEVGLFKYGLRDLFF